MAETAKPGAGTALTLRLRPLPEDRSGRQATLTVCVNVRPDNGISVSCGPRGGLALPDLLRGELARRGLAVEVETIRCLGLCARGPNLRLTPGGSWFHGASPGDAAAIVDGIAAVLDGAVGESP